MKARLDWFPWCFDLAPRILRVKFSVQRTLSAQCLVRVHSLEPLVDSTLEWTPMGYRMVNGVTHLECRVTYPQMLINS